jgi:protein TonB
MFETSVVQTQVRAAAGRLSLLTISIIAHTAVILGAVAVSIASVDFPTAAPDEFAQAPMIVAVRIPPPLGNPNGGAKPPDATKPPAAKPPTPPPSNQIVAPSTVPENVTPVAANDDAATTAGTNPNATSNEPLGVPWGDPNSIGTDLDAPPSPMPAQQVEERIYESYEVKAPVALYRTQPAYPQHLIKTKIPATVVVRCVIDKNGRVRDPQVIVPARMAAFDHAVIQAVQQWRFTPGSRNGVAVETYLNLTVNFSVN